MCGSGELRQTKSVGLSPNFKVESLSSRAWGFVFALDLRRVKTPGNPAMIGSGAVAATPAMVLLIMVGFGGGWRAWARVGEVGRGGVAGSLDGCAGPAWHACVGCF